MARCVFSTWASSISATWREISHLRLLDQRLNIQIIKIMASGPITSWEIDGGTVETVSDFIFFGSKITTDGDCSHGIKRRLKESYDQSRQLIKKQRHYFANKGPSRLWFFQWSCTDVKLGL